MSSEEIKQIVMSLRPIDDDFMNVIFKDNKPLVEYVLRVILDKDDLTVEESKTQQSTDFLGSRNVTFDIFAKDSSGKSYNIEVQRADSGAVAQRARFHSAALDVNSLPSGTPFVKLPDSYVIFITENDVLKGSKPLYHIERSIIEISELFSDGAHIIYVNGAYQNMETAIGKLIHDFKCKNAGEMLCEPMAEVTYKYKNTDEGVDYMCKAVEEYGLKQLNKGRQEGRLEGRQEGRMEGILESVIKFIKKGKLSYEEIADNFDMPVEEVRKLAAQTN